MRNVEKSIARVAGLLFVAAAVLEGVSRLIESSQLHDAARWVLLGALFVVLAPIAVIGVLTGIQKLSARGKSGGSHAA